MSTHYFPNGTLGDKTEETIIEGTNDVIQAYTRTSYYQNNVEDVFKMEIQYTPDNKFVKKILIEEDFEIVGTYEYEYNSKAELEETQSEEFSILTFPNPTTDYIHFGTEEPIERVEIMNTTGQLVIVQNGMNKVSVSHLPSGNYLVNIVTAKGIAQSQFIKE